MNSRERLLAAIHGEESDTVPVGLHCIGTLVPYLRRVIDPQIDDRRALDIFGLDPTLYRGYRKQIRDPEWVRKERIIRREGEESLVRVTIDTPRGQLTSLEKRTPITTWTLEPLVKEPDDIELLRYQPHDVHDLESYRREFGSGYGDGIVRTAVGGQGSAVGLMDPKELCKDFHRRPGWVRELYRFLTDRALGWIEGMPVEYLDLVEIPGHIGNFVSPKIYREQILPFDREVVAAIHRRGLAVTYHDCGLVMHVLELIAETGTDCIETLTPPPFGGDVDLSRAKELVGDRVCLIGGFHQSLIERGPVEAVEARVKECISSAAEGGGYILYNNDHFFEAPLVNLHEYAQSARRYGRYA
jgi:hypothetical protein